MKSNLRTKNVLGSLAAIAVLFSTSACDLTSVFKKNTVQVQGQSSSQGIIGFGQTTVPANITGNGTLGVMDFSMLGRYYNNALNLANYPANALPKILVQAQGKFPPTQNPVEMQSAAAVLSIQQVAAAACRDMIAGEVANGGQSFLSGINVSNGPSKQSQSALDNFFNQISMACTGVPADANALQILMSGYNAAAAAAPGVSSIAGSQSLQTQAALEVACASMCSSALALAQ